MTTSCDRVVAPALGFGSSSPGQAWTSAMLAVVLGEAHQGDWSVGITVTREPGDPLGSEFAATAA